MLKWLKNTVYYSRMMTPVRRPKYIPHPAKLMKFDNIYFLFMMAVDCSKFIKIILFLREFQLWVRRYVYNVKIELLL